MPNKRIKVAGFTPSEIDRQGTPGSRGPDSLRSSRHSSVRSSGKRRGQPVSSSGDVVVNVLPETGISYAESQSPPSWLSATATSADPSIKLLKRMVPHSPSSPSKAVKGPTPPPVRRREAVCSESIFPRICCPLLNHGNTCYFNSCIQVLANCPEFIYGLRNSAFARSRLAASCASTTPVASSPTDFLFDALLQLFYSMQFEVPAERRGLSAEEALEALGTVSPTFQGRSQQDSAEMLSTVLAALEEKGATKVNISEMIATFHRDQTRMPLSLGEEEVRLLSNREDYEDETDSGLISRVSYHAEKDWSSVGSHHWRTLLGLMENINEENRSLEDASRHRVKGSTAARARSLLQPDFAPQQLILSDAISPFTGYTVSETKCHGCGVSSRSVHSFQLLLLDLPSKEERLKTKSCEQFGEGHYGANRNIRTPLVGRSKSLNASVACLDSSKVTVPLRAYEVSSKQSTSGGSGHSAGASTPPAANKGGKKPGVVRKVFSLFGGMFSSSVEESITLKECFAHHFGSVTFKGQNLYKCGACGKMCEATKSESIAHLPDVLLIQMKRFEAGLVFSDSKKSEPVIFPVSWNSTSVESTKKGAKFTIDPEVLDLADFLHPTMRPTYRTSTDEEWELRDDVPPQPASPGEESDDDVPKGWGFQVGQSNTPDFPVSTYCLSAVVNHTGSLGGGHYVAYALKDNKDWVLLNDNDVSTVTEDTVANVEEYILMYRKKPVVSRPESRQAASMIAAQMVMKTAGKNPCLVNGKAVLLPDHGRQTVYISRSWLNRAALMEDPGPILNRVEYVSPATSRDLGNGVPSPPPHVASSSHSLSSSRQAYTISPRELEWFYVPISRQYYLDLYHLHGGNAWLLADELEKLALTSYDVRSEARE